MDYNNKPEMILFDVGGTLFDDGKCIPVNGLAHLRLAADNPDVTDDATLAAVWDEYMSEINVGLKSKSGTFLDIPLSAPIKYVTMKTGLHFSIPMAKIEEIFDRFNSARTVINGVEELLATIDDMGIRTAVISNNAMSGEGLELAVKRWIPSSRFEFFLTSADVTFSKPDKAIFEAAAGYARLDTKDCWYCGDGRIPDVVGAKNSGMTPVLLDINSEIPFEMRNDSDIGEYLAINHWDEMNKYLRNSFYASNKN